MTNEVATKEYQAREGEIVEVVDEEQDTPVTHGAALMVADPSKMLESAQRVADSLKPLIEKNPMTVDINGKQYPRVEVWLTLAMMHGVTARTVETNRLTDDAGNFRGYDATAEVVRLSDGMVIARAEASVTNDEANWKGKDEYALKSMAQTRATSQSLRRVFAYIVTLAGIETTPAEEMDFARNGGKEPSKEELTKVFNKEDLGKCPKCSKPLGKKKGPYGEFVSCTGYPSCKYIQKKGGSR